MQRLERMLVNEHLLLLHRFLLLVPVPGEIWTAEKDPEKTKVRSEEANKKERRR